MLQLIPIKQAPGTELRAWNHSDKISHIDIVIFHIDTVIFWSSSISILSACISKLSS